MNYKENGRIKMSKGLTRHEFYRVFGNHLPRKMNNSYILSYSLYAFIKEDKRKYIFTKEIRKTCSNTI